jgi:hypothetical protein
MSDYGVKTTIDDDDVFTAADKEFSLYTKYVSPKMQEAHVNIYDYTFPDNPSGPTLRDLVTVSHGYSYTPLALVYVKDVTNNKYSMLRYNMSMVVAQRFVYYTNDTTFKIQYDVGAGGPEFDITGYRFIFKYFIWCETGMN